jgi:hypothetical protein
MKHLAAYLLLSLNGGSPSQADVKKLLSSVGIEADEDRLSKLFSELKGKNVNEVPLYLLRILFNFSSWSKKDQLNFHLFLPVEEEEQCPLPLAVVLPQLPQRRHLLKKKRRKNLLRSLMKMYFPVILLYLPSFLDGFRIVRLESRSFCLLSTVLK